jgi:tripartite-type tricarboxylate transporter receptor subunit TctC
MNRVDASRAMQRGRVIRGLTGMALAVWSVVAQAQDAATTYPNRSIRAVVPYPAGGTSDILMRLIGQKLTERWNQQILIDPRPGAAGLIGIEIAAERQSKCLSF